MMPIFITETYKLLDDSVEYDAIIISVLGVLDKILHRLRCVFWMKSEILWIVCF
jgi:hypothetical protein